MAYLTIYTDDAEPAETLATGDEDEIREALAARGGRVRPLAAG